MRTLFINIQQLVQVRAGQDSIQKVAGQHMDQLPIIENAWLLVDNGLIHSYGQMADYEEVSADTVVDASGRLLLPSWVDSHTHLVFAGPREQEFVHRIKGMTYEEIAAKGGGILNSANLLANTSIEDLYASSAARLEQVMQTGTGAIEIKSGYGLSVEAELKMLRVVRLLQQRYDLPIKATLLAAHAYPMAYKQDKPAYVRLIIDEILPKVAEEGLAEYMDVFCEKGFFDVPETSELLIAAKQYGLRP
jgi:imidazolonepropionase